MRWETTVWMSAVLVVATTALHLTMEHDLQINKTSLPGLDKSTKQDIVRGHEELVVSADTKDEEIENASLEHFSRYLIELDPSYNQSKNKENEKSIKYHTDSNSKTSGTSEEEDIESNDDEYGRSNQPDNGDAETIVDGTKTALDTGETESEEEENEEENQSGSGETDSTANPTGTAEDQDITSTPEPGQSTNNPPESGDNGYSTEAGTTSPPAPVDTCTTNPPEPVDTVVVTSTGRVRGHVWRENANILGYIDIKYGIFNNHFEAPVFPEADEDSVHDEKVHSKRCPQLQGDTTVGESDCLTLSIFKPFKAELSGASVLVHIHEGNFINESADPDIYGPEYLVSEEIILVLPNYRLGPLGFLCLQNETAPGNAALKDLALALKWIKSNIENFGGDPENIAVSGEGTAGALAGYLALSPMSKSYVNKVITESGSVLSHWAIDRNPILAATDLGNSITGSGATWQTIDKEALLLAARDFVWRPCLENNTDDGVHFMVETPWAMLQKEHIEVTFMIGSAEYAGVHESLSHTEASIHELNANVSRLLPNDLQFETSEERSKVGNKVKAQYFEDTITLANVKNRTRYYTDVAYLGPVIRTARSLVDYGSTVYFYEFSFVGTINRELAAVQNQADGAVRGDIIGYLFYQGDMPDEGTKERKMIEQLIQFWSSFLKTGTPKAEDIEWNKFEKATAAQEQWMSIGTETAMKSGVHMDRLGLWTEIYNEHFIDRSLALAVSPSVYTVLVLQGVFFISFFRNAWHFF